MKSRFLQTSLSLATLLLLALGTVLWLQRDSSAPGAVLRVGLYENEPKVYLDGRGRPAGFFVELLTDIARREGWHLQWIPCEWQDCLAQLAAGQLDLMPDVALSDDRRDNFDFHRLAVSQSWSQLYTNRYDRVPQSPEDLAGWRIALLRGGIQEPELARILEARGIDWEQVPVDSFAEGFALTLQGQADGVVTNNFFGGRNRERYSLVETPLTFSQVGLYFAATKGQAGDVLSTIDRHLEAWRADPASLYYTALSRSLTPPVRRDISVLLGTALALTLLLALALLLAGRTLRWRIREQTRELRETNERLNQLLDGSPVILYSIKPGTRHLNWVSGNIRRILGFSPGQALQDGWWQRQLFPEDRSTADAMLQRLRHERQLRFEYRLHDAWGKLRYIRDELQLLPPREHKDAEIIGTWTDLTPYHEQEARLSHLTRFDPLTDLVNRTHLEQRLDALLEDARDNAEHLAVIFIDLDRFKQVNESLGSVIGDKILRLQARRIGRLLGHDTLLARMSADEFCAVLPLRADATPLEETAELLLARLREPLQVHRQSLVLTASIGISRYPLDAQSAAELVTRSELSMVAAKQAGGDSWHLYESRLTDSTRARFRLENALRHASARGEWILHYQPQFSLDRQTLIGIEALVRWQHPELGLLLPGEFIPLAEETGLVHDIDRWVLGEACRQMVDWDAVGFVVPRMSVNVAMSELDSGELLDSVSECLQATGLPPTRLELEITESMVMQAPESALRSLEDLSAMGVHLALDDFGTGYSNLAYIGSLPLDRMKLDRSFVQRIRHSQSSATIVRAIIKMAKALQLEVIAEGIEDAEELELLRSEGCDGAQGDLLAPPLTAELLLLRHGPARSAAGT